MAGYNVNGFLQEKCNYYPVCSALEGEISAFLRLGQLRGAVNRVAHTSAKPNQPNRSQ